MIISNVPSFAFPACSTLKCLPNRALYPKSTEAHWLIHKPQDRLMQYMHMCQLRTLGRNASQHIETDPAQPGPLQTDYFDEKLAELS